MIFASIIATLSLFDFATNSIAQRIVEADPAVCLSRFVGYPNCFRKSNLHAPITNPSFWLKDVDFSCVSPWNNARRELGAGTAISRRHIVFAKHFPIPNGARILFTDGEIGVCPCRIVGSKSIPDSDIAIGLLDCELTPNIKSAKILPENYVEWMPMGLKWPVVTFDQNERVYLSEVESETYGLAKKMRLRNARCDNPERRTFGGNLVRGDSGNPAFLLVGNQAVLLYCLTVGGAGHGTMLHNFRREMQKAMDDLCPGYYLETFDFSRFSNERGLGK